MAKGPAVVEVLKSFYVGDRSKSFFYNSRSIVIAAAAEGVERHLEG